MNPDWTLILGAIGTVSGLLALMRWVIKDISALKRQPRLKILGGPTVKNWKFINTGETRRFATLNVKNRGSQTAKRCVAVAEIIEQPKNVAHLDGEYGLHWADVPYSGRSTGAEPVDIGTEPRRLDVAFSLPNHSGAWMAMPLALSVPSQIPQAALPPGEYILKVRVSCENGRGDAKLFKLTSASNWDGLDMKETRT